MLRTSAIVAMAAAIFCTQIAPAGAGRTGTHVCRGADASAVDEASRRQSSRALLCLVNRARADQGVRPVRKVPRLSKAAVAHSRDMVATSFFSHVGSDGELAYRRAARAGYPRHSRHAMIGETLAWGSGPSATPAKLVAAFLHSPPHRRTLLDASFRDIGVGLVIGAPRSGVESATTVTLVFGHR